MSFTVDDFQDLLRLLAEHPEWQAELRHRVLTDDLLTLPAVVRQLAERVNRLAEVQEQTAVQLQALAEHVDSLTERVDRLAEAQERTAAQLAALTEAQMRTEARLKYIEDKLAAVQGEVLELRYARRAGAYFSPLARRLRVLDPGRLADQLDDAVDAGQLTAQERAAILAADLVLTGVRRDDRAEIYLVAEVSVGIGVSDVARAMERARLLAKLGQPVVPIVAGERIDPESEALARAHDVWQVLDGHSSPPGQP
jgi:hypothetical protein